MSPRGFHYLSYSSKLERRRIEGVAIVKFHPDVANEDSPKTLHEIGVVALTNPPKTIGIHTSWPMLTNPGPVMLSLAPGMNPFPIVRQWSPPSVLC